MARSQRSIPTPKDAQSYRHPESERQQIAVKVIDPRGNDLLVVKKLETTGKEQ